MHLIRLLPTIVLLFPSIVVSKSRPDAVLLSSIQSLTLRNDRQTSHRRVAAVPQLNCVGGNARDRYEVDMMRCTNSGSDYEANDVQWTCRAELPEEFKLGSTDVICEGYDSAEDPYVLKGSCGVEYRLVLTGKGEERFGIPEESKFSRSNIERILFFMFFAAVASVIGYNVWMSCTGRNPATRPARRRPGGGWGGGGGDGFDDDGNDPPPPYTPRAAPKKTSARTTNQAGQQGWRPGFWTGAAAGAAGGYMAGNRNSTRNPDPQVGSSRTGGGGRSSSGYGGGSSFAGSSPSHTSTGFGGTSRR